MSRSSIIVPLRFFTTLSVDFCGEPTKDPPAERIISFNFTNVKYNSEWLIGQLVLRMEQSDPTTGPHFESRQSMQREKAGLLTRYPHDPLDVSRLRILPPPSSARVSCGAYD